MKQAIYHQTGKTILCFIGGALGMLAVAWLFGWYAEWFGLAGQ